MRRATGAVKSAASGQLRPANCTFSTESGSSNETWQFAALKAQQTGHTVVNVLSLGEAVDVRRVEPRSGYDDERRPDPVLHHPLGDVGTMELITVGGQDVVIRRVAVGTFVRLP